MRQINERRVNIVARLFLVATFFVFVWHLEVGLALTELDAMSFTNGWGSWNGTQVYHATMYLHFIAILFAFVLLERNQNNG
jgi:hypothetical protein